MPNPRPKGVEYMRALGRRGGLKSGETRRIKRAMRILARCAEQRGTPIPEELPSEPKTKRRNRSGGSHDSDWRCPRCRSFNMTERHICGRCWRVCLHRITRGQLRERSAEHRTAAILRRHGL
jgi:hypothetical protein